MECQNFFFFFFFFFFFVRHWKWLKDIHGNNQLFDVGILNFITLLQLWFVYDRNVGLVTNIPTTEYLSAWQVLGNLEIAEVLRDYVTSNPQREEICLFLSSWLGIGYKHSHNRISQCLTSIRKLGNRRSSEGLRNFKPSKGRNVFILIILAGDWLQTFPQQNISVLDKY